ncbi:hypothetical protein AOQ84DRAFT_356228 [Glonium stellatum]|uniref:Uncharacterized protein n=1 Tax=Glonium stellatum TaxID=574774 RepID=A0A8E2EU20_9PEZI|nr:hypothetical protein AOQ84DRAFT_356228 [Glonium stellatum]
MKLFSLGKLAVVCFAALSVAHPGEVEHENAAGHLAKRQFYFNACRSLAKCANHLETRGVLARAEARRKAAFNTHQKTPGQCPTQSLKGGAPGRLHNRDTDSVLNTLHHSNRTGLTANTAECEIFSSNLTCILNPERETSPY